MAELSHQSTREPRVRLVITGDRDGLMRPSPYAWLDGDGRGNLIGHVGVNVVARTVDPFFDVGLDICAAPGSLVYRVVEFFERLAARAREMRHG